MSIYQKIQDIEHEMAKTQKNKGMYIINILYPILSYRIVVLSIMNLYTNHMIPCITTHSNQCTSRYVKSKAGETEK